jgi:ribosomal protein S18 acetylase RimI-like enzyme
VITTRIQDKQTLLLEELSLNSWPALSEANYDGWVLRLANRFADRCNCVWPLYGSNLGLETKVRRCEEFYQSRGQPVIFRITSDGSRRDLDQLLDDRGYSLKTPTIVQTLDLTQQNLGAREDAIAVGSDPRDGWVDDVAELVGLTAGKETYGQIVHKIIWPLGLARGRESGRLVSLGLGVTEDKYVGIYGMNTRTSHRRQGWGRRILKALLNWGAGCGATTAYLHVEADNSPARKLYEKLGFQEVYSYWYRVSSSRHTK